MGTIIPDTGRDWIANKIIPGETAAELKYVSIGTGTTKTASDDTALASEIHRSDTTGQNSSVSKNSLTGSVRVSVTISGGTEVPSGADITELGVFTADDELIYREVRDVVTIDDGERITFEFTISFVN